MKESLDKKIIEESDYYLDNNVTMEEAGNHFGMCKKSFQLHMKKLESIYPEKFVLVEKKKNDNLAKGTVKGGQNGKPTKIGSVRRKHVISVEDSILLAKKMIEADWGFRDAEKFTGIPKSTISDNLTKERIGEELYEELSSLLESHKPGKHL